MRLARYAAIAVTTVMLSWGVIAAAPAPAVQGPVSSLSASSCNGPLHTYRDAGYRGGWKRFCSSDKDLSNNKFDNGAKVDEQITSVKNTGGCYWSLFRKKNFHGVSTRSYPHTKDPNLSNDAVGNDAARSLRQEC
ncbi:hypothetical protein [Streptomyces sp. SLBN-8D4]|uniref:hypothetical protein n=1 Tax=Streptomyces sp. SLBN-8D4 TaxID=3377728 RepID=UPI003C7BFDCA